MYVCIAFQYSVVTGVHLTKHNGMFGLAISERKLLSYGRLKPTNNYFHSNFPSWKVAQPKFQLTDPDVYEGIDYHTLNYENRSINFDTVTVPEGTLVTGVRFQLHHGHIQLGVRATEFDFESGTLFNLENSTWYTNVNSGKNKIVVSKAKPIGLMGRPIINDIPDAYTEFSPSDIDADAAQSIVPFLETSKVEPIVPTILSGISLIYKGKPGYSGVIAPKLIVYDFAPYFRSIETLD